MPPHARSRRTTTPRVSEQPRVLVRESIAAAGLELLRSRFEVVEDGESDLAAMIGDFDAIVVRSATTLDASLIERADTAQGHRPCRSRRRQRRRRRGHATRNRRRERGRVDRRLGGRARDRAAACARPEHSAGARRSEVGHVGARALHRESSSRARRSAFSASGGSAGRSRSRALGLGMRVRRLRPVRRRRALPRARRRVARGSLEEVYAEADVDHAAPSAERRDATPCSTPAHSRR